MTIMILTIIILIIVIVVVVVVIVIIIGIGIGIGIDAPWRVFRQHNATAQVYGKKGASKTLRLSFRKPSLRERTA